MLALGAKGGTDLRLTAEGDDAGAALDAMRGCVTALKRSDCRPRASGLDASAATRGLSRATARSARRPLRARRRSSSSRTHRAHRAHARGAHAQLVRAEPHEQRHRQRIGGGLAADLDRNPGRVRRAHRRRDVSQDARVVRGRLAVAEAVGAECRVR